jgi:hypothetical protein
MRQPRRKMRSEHSLDRRVSDDEIFEHVIHGGRVNHVRQMLRDMDVLTQHPRSAAPAPRDERNGCRPH